MSSVQLVQSLSLVPFFATPWTAVSQASLSITNSWSLLKLMSIELVMPSNHLILCHPLLLPSIFPSIRVFSNESVLHLRWPKCWSFSFSISPSNGYSGLTSFRMDWFDILAVPGTLKSLLQDHSWKASALQCSAFGLFRPFSGLAPTVCAPRHRRLVSSITGLYYSHCTTCLKIRILIVYMSFYPFFKINLFFIEG